MKAKWITFYLLLFAAAGITLQGCFPSQDDTNSQTTAEVKAIDTYLSAQGATDVIRDNASGIRFIVHSYGNGAPPSTGQRVKGSYVGQIFNASGTFQTFTQGDIDDNIDDITPQGLRYAFGVILEGSEATVFVPSQYGYGKTGTTDVPANSVLVYTVTLEDVIPTATQETQFKTDTAAIAKFLKDSAVANVTYHPAGFWYKIDQPGTGDSPTPYSIATFDYTVRLLANNKPGTILQQGPLTDQGIFGLINGLKVGFPLLREGASATFYIPSGLGYGPAGSSPGIPGNANLIFTIKLNSFQKPS